MAVGGLVEFLIQSVVRAFVWEAGGLGPSSVPGGSVEAMVDSQPGPGVVLENPMKNGKLVLMSRLEAMDLTRLMLFRNYELEAM